MVTHSTATCFLAALCCWPWLSHIEDISEFVCVRLAQRKPYICSKLDEADRFEYSNISVSKVAQHIADLTVSGLILTFTEKGI